MLLVTLATIVLLGHAPGLVSGGELTIAQEAVTHDFGPVWSESPLSHVFRLQAEGPGSTVITKIRPT